MNAYSNQTNVSGVTIANDQIGTEPPYFNFAKLCAQLPPDTTDGNFGGGGWQETLPGNVLAHYGFQWNGIEINWDAKGRQSFSRLSYPMNLLNAGKSLVVSKTKTILAPSGLGSDTLKLKLMFTRIGLG
jgi:hypothetical protein